MTGSGVPRYVRDLPYRDALLELFSQPKMTTNQASIELARRGFVSSTGKKLSRSYLLAHLARLGVKKDAKQWR